MLILSPCKLSRSGSHHYYSRAFALKYFENWIRQAGRKGKLMRELAIELLGIRWG